MVSLKQFGNLMTATLIFALLQANTLMAKSINFSNFNTEIKLKATTVTNEYTVNDTVKTVFLSNELIVVTTKALSREKLKQQSRRIKEVKQLYLAKDSNYYLVSLKKSKSLAKVMKKLTKKKGIKLVQPDILQINTKAHDDHSHNKKPRTFERVLPRYLKLTGIEKLWNTTKGKGITIAIIDDGFDLQHEDLKHIGKAFSYDAQRQQLTSKPQIGIDTHGTKIAGVIFAAHNTIGINGIAPDARLVAIRQPDTWTSKILLSFQLAKSAGADIVNCSWNSQFLMQPVKEVIDDLAVNGRNGKGVAVVIAAGNSNAEIKPHSTEASIESAIVVGANAFFWKRKLKTSNFGETVDLSAFGRNVKTTLPNNKYGVFAGTSLSTAIVSGLSALLLSENPDMDLTQLQQALINSLQFEIKKRITKP